MLDAAKNLIKGLLAADTCDGVLGLSKNRSGVCPNLFEHPDEVESLILSPKWVLAKEAVFLLNSQPPGFRLAVICRGCDQRALTELIKRNQVDGTRLHMVGLACDQDQAAACRCDRPFPDPVDIGVAIEAAGSFDDGENPFLNPDTGVRKQAWEQAFQKCVKCYGCRNACPMCLCTSCKLEDEIFSPLGSIPADPMGFHLIRAFHMADACVGCGACEDACPADIPLRLLIRPMQQVLETDHGFPAGTARHQASPLPARQAGDGTGNGPKPLWTDSLKVE